MKVFKYRPWITFMAIILLVLLVACGGGTAAVAVEPAASTLVVSTATAVEVPTDTPAPESTAVPTSTQVQPTQTPIPATPTEVLVPTAIPTEGVQFVTLPSKAVVSFFCKDTGTTELFEFYTFDTAYPLPVCNTVEMHLLESNGEMNIAIFGLMNRDLSSMPFAYVNRKSPIASTNTLEGFSVQSIRDTSYSGTYFSGGYLELQCDDGVTAWYYTTQGGTVEDVEFHCDLGWWAKVSTLEGQFVFKDDSGNETLLPNPVVGNMNYFQSPYEDWTLEFVLPDLATN